MKQAQGLLDGRSLVRDAGVGQNPSEDRAIARDLLDSSKGGKKIDEKDRHLVFFFKKKKFSGRS